MKRIIFAAIFVFFLAFARVVPAYAACEQRTFIGDGAQNCPASWTRCGLDHLNYCCSDNTQCSDPTQHTAGADPNDQGTDLGSICDAIPDAKQKKACTDCFGKGSSWTALGCISTAPNDFLSKLLTFSVGMAGGIAFLLILFGGFQIMTSAGNPEQLNAGRELVTSAITGLLIIIFSIFILRLIGVNILGIPGFQ